MCTELRYLWAWKIIGYLLIILVVWLSLTPKIPESGIPIGDKISHLLAYGVLMGWFAQWHKKNHYYRLALGLISMGIALEFIQAQTGYRFLEIADIFANSLGIFLAWVVLSYTACARILLYLETRL